MSKVTPEEGTRMWLYLPALQQAKELSASRQEGSFAGSTISFEEIGSWSMSEEYNAEIVEKTEIEIGEELLPAYELALTPKEGADPQYPKRRVWIGEGNWLLLHSKDFNSEGEIQKDMKVNELTTFEGNKVTKELVTTDVETGASTTVIYETRKRLAEEIPDSLFDPENLSTFDPARWGLTE